MEPFAGNSPPRTPGDLSWYFDFPCITHNYPGTGSWLEWVMWSDAFCFSYLPSIFFLPGLSGFGRWAGCLSCFSGLTTKFENLTQTMSAVGTWQRLRIETLPPGSRTTPESKLAWAYLINLFPSESLAGVVPALKCFEINSDRQIAEDEAQKMRTP